MATLERATAARDQLADTILDGTTVISVGIVNDGDGYGVGIVVATPIDTPELTGDLADVTVTVEHSPGGPIELHATHA